LYGQTDYPYTFSPIAPLCIKSVSNFIVWKIRLLTGDGGWAEKTRA